MKVRYVVYISHCMGGIDYLRRDHFVYIQDNIYRGTSMTPIHYIPRFLCDNNQLYLLLPWQLVHNIAHITKALGHDP
jgi:hypothetical protein